MPQHARALSGALVIVITGALTLVAAGPASPAPGHRALGWGTNSFGQVGDATTTQRKIPVKVRMPAGVSFTTISAGYAHSLAMASDGSARAWGSNSHSQLGDQTTTNRTVPVRVKIPRGVSFTAVSAGARHSLALSTDGAAWAWGWNAQGQLGDGTTSTRGTPVRVQMPTGVSFTAISAGSYHSLASASDGTVWAWGANSFGQLGDGTILRRTSPVQVQLPAGVSIAAVSGGVYHSLARGADGRAWAWGFNRYGEIGDGTRTNRLSPVSVHAPVGTTFTAVSAGYYFSLALASDGSAWAWGSNYAGQLGDGTKTDHSTPEAVHMPAQVTFTALSAGLYHGLAVASDGKGWAWGRNNSGQLGDGTTTSRSLPVLVLTSAKIAIDDVDAGGAHSLALFARSPATKAPRPMANDRPQQESSARSGGVSTGGPSLGAGFATGPGRSAPDARSAPSGAVDWPKFRFDLANTGYNVSETVLGVSNVAQLTTKWTADAGGQVYSSPAVVGGVAYVGSDDGNLYAFDAETGSELWASPTSGTITGSSPAVSDGVVYVTSSSIVGGLYAFDAATGNKLWTAPTGGVADSSPSVANGIVYVGSQDGSLHAYDAATGVQLWAAPAGGTIVNSSPAVVDGVVYIGSGNTTVLGTMNAYDATTGIQLWVATLPDRIISTPAVSNGLVFAGSEDGNVYAFDAATGATQWSSEVGMFGFTPAVANGAVYVGANPGVGHHQFYAFDAATGATLWTSDEVGIVDGGPAVANGVVYVGSNNNVVYALDAATGFVLWQQATGSYITSSPAVVNAVVVIGSHDHLLYAFGLPSGGGQ